MNGTGQDSHASGAFLVAAGTAAKAACRNFTSILMYLRHVGANGVPDVCFR